MNSYTFGINSAWWLAALTLALGFALSLWYYARTHPPVPPTLRAVLFVLRGLGLALLAFVLFEPVLTFLHSSEEDAHLSILFDNSTSVSANDALGSRRIVYEEALKSADLKSLGDKAQTHVFDESIRRISEPVFDSLTFKGQRTDIEKALRYVADNSELNNTQAVLIVTDGVFNAGANPMYQAEQLAKPIYVIGIGDTTEPKDASIQSLVTNDVCYVGSVLPLNVNCKVSGFGQTNARVVLSDNGERVSEQVIAVSKEQQNYSLTFEYKASKEGMRKLTASIESLDGELTSKNNQLSEFVTVRADKRKIVLFAGAPSADLSFIRAAFESDKSIQLICFIQKSGSEFYDQAPSAAALREAEVIVFVGFPVQSTPANALQLVLTELQRSKPLLFLTSQQVDYTKLRVLEDYLPFSVQTSRTNEFSVVADVRSNGAMNPMLRLKGTSEDQNIWNNLPPVFRTETFVRVKPEAEVIASMKVNNVALSDPLIVSRSFQKSKCVAVLGYGLYRWKLLGNAAEQSRGKVDAPDALRALMLNSSKWLTTNDDEKVVRIRTSRKQYASTERVEFIAQVYDAAMAAIDNATVTVKVSGSGDAREVVLASVGGGRYIAGMEGLTEGDYSFNGTVVVNNRPYGSDGAKFSVGDLAIEYQNLRMNVELLRGIAERSGGVYYEAKDASQFLDDLKNNKRFVARVVTRSTEFSLWNLAYLLAAALSCFALEWVLRKRAGMV